MLRRQDQKHVMLSYEWKVQRLVLSIYDYLVQKELSVWMDIKAGVPSDNLYEGIAEAVENSSCFVCFMTPEYQESDFCKQELQYAKQCKIPIIPLKLQENWDPSSWLGFITAGLLWLDFYHIKNFEKKAAKLFSRISSTIGERSQPQVLNTPKPIRAKKARESKPISKLGASLPSKRTEIDDINFLNPERTTFLRDRRSLSRTPVSNIKNPESIRSPSDDEDVDHAKMSVRLPVNRGYHRADV